MQTVSVKHIKDARMEGDDENTTKELSEVITQSGSRMSLSTILRG